jgi:hypothetical protein
MPSVENKLKSVNAEAVPKEVATLTPVSEFNPLGTAQFLALLQYRVFPVNGIRSDGECTCGKRDCPNAGKHPAIINGVKGATTDSSVIKNWNWEGKNVGIAPDGTFFVLDVDGESGAASLQRLVDEHGPLPKTPQVKTARGYHFYFKLPEGVIIKNKVGFADGLDIRSQGGYVIAPGSKHRSGAVYMLVVSLRVEIAVAPQWLVDMLIAPKTYCSAKELEERSDGFRQAESEEFSGGNTPIQAFGADEILAEVAKTVSSATQGTRNDTLNRMSFIIGNYVGSGQVDEQHAKDLLYKSARLSGLTATEALATINSGLTAGIRSPRYIYAGRKTFDQVGLGNWFVERCGHNLRYLNKTWLHWTGTHWEVGEDNTVGNLFIGFVDTFSEELETSAQKLELNAKEDSDEDK